MRLNKLSLLLFLLLISAVAEQAFAAGGGAADVSRRAADIIYLDHGYGNEAGLSVWQILSNRVKQQPFHLISALVFVLAIVHTFFTHKFTAMAHEEAEKHELKKQKKLKEDRFAIPEQLAKDVSFRAEVLHFLGEVEVVFGLWIVPLLITMAFYTDWLTAVNYIETRNYTEPLFVIVIMSLASSRPIIKFAEGLLSKVAKLGGGAPAAWWASILILGPLMGSLITEPGAMTISALLLAKRFYKLEPSRMFKYATLGLLFVNVSVGGVLTHFAAPPVLMVAAPWDWDTPFMLEHFGWKAAIGIMTSVAVYFVLFRKELAELKVKSDEQQEDQKKHPSTPVPVWITCVHLLLLVWTVMHAHHPIVFIGAFLFYLGFYQATAPHQSVFSLRPALLVGFFLAGLIVHGGLQRWWLEPVLAGVSETMLLFLAMGLTAFNDNAAVTYLTTLIPSLTDGLKYAVVAGAVTGGGLTVIANAPNPAGQSLLNSYFEDGVSPAYLFLGALIPTGVLAACFLFF